MRRIFALIILAFLILSTITSCAFWYDFYDVIGLTLYKEQKIVEVIPSVSRYYLITEEGNGYVMGGYHKTHSTKYRNAELIKNQKLGTFCSPVMFFEGSIKEAWVYSEMGLLFTTEDGSLYDLHDMDVNFVCNNVRKAWKYDTSGDYLLDCKSGEYLVINELNQLFVIKSSNEIVFLFDNVLDVRTTLSTLYVLFSDGTLYEFLNFKDGVDIEDGNVVFNNVEKFEFSNDFDGSEFRRTYPIDLKKIENTPINVLTNDGELYVKGEYDLNEAPCIEYGVKFVSQNYTEWTKIADNVVDFSVSKIGTIMLLENNDCIYFGFNDYGFIDVPMKELVSVEFGCKHLKVDAPVGINIASQTIVIETNDCFYIWSSNTHMILYKEREVFSSKHSVFTGIPFVINK